MKYTNRNNFPQPIYDAITEDRYTKGKADISVTGLLQPPRKRVLCKQNEDKLVKDVAEGLEALLGTAFHALIEKHSKGVEVEIKLFSSFSGWLVKGAVDCYNPVTGELSDYKTTSIFHVKNGLPPEWEQQVNIYAELLRQDGKEVKSACIWAYLKDWRNAESLKDERYPKCKLIRMEVPLWSSEKTVAYIEERVKLHKEAEASLPLCTDEERWSSETQYAVMKKGRKSAVRLFETREAANLLAQGSTELYVEERPGLSRRCELYCEAKPFCLQYAALKTAKPIEQGE